jgi:hypothetical protein
MARWEMRLLSVVLLMGECTYRADLIILGIRW